jgi:hypothetical protein
MKFKSVGNRRSGRPVHFHQSIKDMLEMFDGSQNVEGRWSGNFSFRRKSHGPQRVAYHELHYISKEFVFCAHDSNLTTTA